MKKSFFGLIVFLILLTTYKPKFDLKKLFKVNIKNIEVLDASILNENSIKEDLKYLHEKNLFFLNKKEITKNLTDRSYIDSFIIKKVYPNTLRIRIKEKELVAILQLKKKKFYISSKGDLLDFIEIKKYKHLPTVFGSEKGFHTLYNSLKNIDFPIDNIKSFYSFDSGRWDLIMINNKTIKLPVKNYVISLKNFMELKKQNNFETYKIFDYRIEDQLILN